MTEKKIHVNDIEEAKLLVNHTMACAFDIDLVSDRYVVNAKSIMGIFSLDRNSSITLRADCAADDPFFEQIQSLIIE